MWGPGGGLPVGRSVRTGVLAVTVVVRRAGILGRPLSVPVRVGPRDASGRTVCAGGDARADVSARDPVSHLGDRPTTQVAGVRTERLDGRDVHARRVSSLWRQGRRDAVASIEPVFDLLDPGRELGYLRVIGPLTDRPVLEGRPQAVTTVLERLQSGVEVTDLARDDRRLAPVAVGGGDRLTERTRLDGTVEFGPTDADDAG